jgi:hypothetical protein
VSTRAVGARPFRSCRSAPAGGFRPSAAVGVSPTSTSHDSFIVYPNPRAVGVPRALETFSYTLVFLRTLKRFSSLLLLRVLAIPRRRCGCSETTSPRAFSASNTAAHPRRRGTHVHRADRFRCPDRFLFTTRPPLVYLFYFSVRPILFIFIYMYKQSYWFPNSQPFSSHAGGWILAN